ncbi:Meiotically up-regulated protein [Erysiphe necator]|uniref:Putative kh domain-containing protein n=1 Tax=Uncinula necator TaxID=52586 RepID=A0A0B1P4I2_UNCNE|nr:Meiotically up-regulated protein [Erysiphe necator]KHJ32235.1 putative kh domain-containing protein [Erysiphe necator]
MNKLANMRHWSERMGPGFGLTRQPNMNVNTPTILQPNSQPKSGHGQASNLPLGVSDAPIHYSFNVPFASDLAGPNIEEILYATNGAVERWTHPANVPDDVPIYQLPIHSQNVTKLRKMCADITSGPLPIEAYVKSSEPKRVKGQVTNVCLSGSPELLHKTRETILNETPLALRRAVVEVSGELIINGEQTALKTTVVDYLDSISEFCGVDIFLLGPKFTSLADAQIMAGNASRDPRWRVAIYGDMESVDHAKTRVLIFIDRLLGRVVDITILELSLHTVICGRFRKHIKLIESTTNTAIYFPPPFSHVYRYCPAGAQRRNPEEIFITGETPLQIALAKQKIHDLVTRTRIFMKDTVVSAAKIDSILLTRLDKVRKIMESNGTFIQFPALASQRNMIRIQGTEGLHVERTVRDFMCLTGQFYSASWWIQHVDSSRLPSPADIRTMLSDICANSDADVSFDKLTFTITGSDDAVKAALMVISEIKFVTRAQYQIRVKIELANEHKEFVSGKKNGKINKIMGQSSVQIIFDGFNEYNFNIDVCAVVYDTMKTGLSLVEQEMPASISFHVPDQYHKRIIGIGGQHIQQIMKKHSVFVKFSNAMDRGGAGREDDDMKVDNVVCRTPARNAHNLELVKYEILDLVDRVDSEFTSSTVTVDRLFHRQLITHISQLSELEKKWNCKITFPSTEEASDDVIISGPEWQVPQCVDEFLGMVPDRHELVLIRTPELLKFLESEEFRNDLIPKFKSQYVIDVKIKEYDVEMTEDSTSTITLLWTFTRNVAGGVRDAIDFLHANLAIAGIEVTTVKGAILRPKSDSFEDSLQYFDSKLLQHAPAPVKTDLPSKSSFTEDVTRERCTILDKLRKPGSMSSISAFLDRRKNSSQLPATSFFKNGCSRNVSKSSLISIESSRSFNADRNPWNDSGVNLPDDESPSWPARHFVNGSISSIENKNFPPKHPSDATPRHILRESTDSGRPSTSNSTNSGYSVLVLKP